MYNICTAIQAGVVSESLAPKNPGPFNHSRWLTTAARICRLYVSVSEKDTRYKNLEILLHFVVTMYAKQWFSIKQNCTNLSGAKMYLEKFKLVKIYVSKNAYFAHQEHILTCMISDENEEIPKRAVQILINIERNKRRKFLVPTINFAATSYMDLVDLDSVDLTFPPLLNNYSNDDIKDMAKTKPSLQMFPCHTQAVERCVRLVTTAASHVHDHERRDSFVKATINCRQNLPCFRSKKTSLKFFIFFIIYIFYGVFVIFEKID